MILTITIYLLYAISRNETDPTMTLPVFSDNDDTSVKIYIYIMLTQITLIFVVVIGVIFRQKIKGISLQYKNAIVRRHLVYFICFCLMLPQIVYHTFKYEIISSTTDEGETKKYDAYYYVKTILNVSGIVIFLVRL